MPSVDEIAIAAKQRQLQLFSDLNEVMLILFGDISGQISRLDNDVRTGVEDTRLDIRDRLEIIRQNVNVSVSFVSRRIITLRERVFREIEALVLAAAAEQEASIVGLLATIGELISNNIAFLKTDLFNAIGTISDRLSTEIGNIRFLFDDVKTFLSQGLDSVVNRVTNSILPALGVLKSSIVDTIKAGPQLLIDLIVSLFFEEIPDEPT